MNRFAFTLVLAITSAAAVAQPPSSFSQAKSLLADQVYSGHQVTFYCGCDYQESPVPGKTNRTRLAPVAKSCGLKPRKNANRAGRIEWEHVVPAWEFGHQLQCWQGNGGRKACQANPRFREMEADMHNLVPVVGELNADRSNFSYGMIPGEPRAYGQCDFEVVFKARIAEPAENVRGDVARIYFYMEDRYGLKISRKQRQLFQAWNRQDPIDQWEQERERRIATIQGNRNRFVAAE